MKISKLLRLRDEVLTDGDVGVEIEVEGEGLPHVLEKYWNVEYDGSLRGESEEYVLRNPSTLEEVQDALGYLRGEFDERGSEIYKSVRCGVHVHINVQDLTLRELYNFITMYALFEDVLLEYCGKTRRGNLFCLPLATSDLLVEALVNVLEHGQLSTLHDDNYRYCAMNVKSLHSYGSLEFRAMEGGDLDKVYNWASVLLNLRDMARRYKSPLAIVEKFNELGSLRFFNRTMLSHKRLFTGIKYKKRKLQNGLSAAMPIAYGWEWCKERKQ